MKPQRQQINYNNINNELKNDQKYTLNEDTLRKLQQLINSGQIKLTIDHTHADHNHDGDDDYTMMTKNDRGIYGKAYNAQLPVQPYTMAALPMPISVAALMPYPLYYNSLPTLLTPLSPDVSSANQIDYSQYTRQAPSVPFQIPWPLAPFFPILIKDPLLTFIQGGSFNNLFEYGQNADVCGKKQTKSGRLDDEKFRIDDDTQDDVRSHSSTRTGRALKKRNISNYAYDQDLSNTGIKKSPKRIQKTKIIKKKPVIQEDDDEETYENKKGDETSEGDLRFPFGDFGWFGNKKPVAPSPGFFINRLKVHRGGVAIAGPGGVATAGRGGTAIVGPGGLAYTQPGGLAVAGPAARVVAVSADTDLSDVISRLRLASVKEGTAPRKIDPLPDGKVVAKGPILYYHEEKQT